MLCQKLCLFLVHSHSFLDSNWEHVRMLPARVKEIRLCMSVHGIAVGIECRSSARARFWVGPGKGY